MLLRIALEYELGSDAFRALLRQSGDVHGGKRFWQWVRTCWLWFTAMLLGLACAFVGGFYFSGCLILVILIRIVMNGRAATFAAPAEPRARSIRLEITDDGLTEYEDGIQSVMPWSSMRHWVQRDGFLFITLQNDLFATIAPTDTQGRRIEVEDISRLLVAQGVKAWQ